MVNSRTILEQQRDGASKNVKNQCNSLGSRVLHWLFTLLLTPLRCCSEIILELAVVIVVLFYFRSMVL